LFGLHAAGYYSAGYGSSSWLLCNFLGFKSPVYYAAGLLYRLFGLHAAGYYSAGYGSSSWLLCNFLGFKSPVIMQLLKVQVAGYYAAGLLYRLFIIPLG